MRKALSENVEFDTFRQTVSTAHSSSSLTILSSNVSYFSETSTSGGSHFALAVVVSNGNFLFIARRHSTEDHSLRKSGSPDMRPASNFSSETKECTRHRSGRSCFTTSSTTGQAPKCLQSTITGMFEVARSSTASHRGIESKNRSEER